jgi:hypothetical protein
VQVGFLLFARWRLLPRDVLTSLCIRRSKNDGTIAAKDLELLLTRHGDRIDTASFIQFLQFCGLERLTTGDSVDYTSLVDTVLTALKAANS